MHAADRNQHLNVTVAALTQDRPQMLHALLAFSGKMDLPRDVTVIPLVVENGKVESSRAMVEEFDCAKGLKARDRLIEFGLDRIAFVDDDEEVAQDWHARLVAGYRNSSAVLLGAPLRMRLLCADCLTWSQRLMQRSLEARYLQKEKRAARLVSLNDTPRVTIVTNNWLGEVSLFSQHQIWFNEKQRFTGGTDSEFYSEFCRRGPTTGWVKGAMVYETVPQSRLYLYYQYCRGRDYHRRLQKQSMARLGLLIIVPFRLIEVIFLAGSLPFTQGRTYADIACNLGWIVGRITASIGRRFGLYTKVTGS